MAPITATEVCAHFAYCLFYFVKDYSAAQKMFNTALNYHQSEIHSVAPNTMCWVYEHYAKLLGKMALHAEALSLWSRRIELGKQHGIAIVEPLIQKAATYEALNRFKEAENTYAYLMKNMPASREQQVDIVLKYAWACHYQRHNYPKAVELYDIVLKLEPENPHVLVQLAWCKQQCPNYSAEEINSHYENAVKAIEIAKYDNARVDTTSEAGTVDPGTPQKNGGIRHMRPARKHLWDSCYVYGECAVYHHDRTKKLDVAKDMYLKALSSNAASENYPQVAANYAILLHYSFGETEQAEAWFQRAMGARPPHFTAAHLYAGYLTTTGQTEKAIAHLQMMSKQFPREEAAIAHRLAKLEEQRPAGDGISQEDALEKAQSLYVKALGGDAADSSDSALLARLAANPFHPATGDLLSFLQHRRRDHKFTEQAYNVVLSKIVTPTLAVNFARFQMDQLRKPKAALKVLRTALKRLPYHPIIVDHTADIIATSNPSRKDVAEALHLRCIAHNRTQAMPYFYYAAFLTFTYPSYLRAMEMYQKALLLDSREALIHSCYASLLETIAHGPEEVRDKVAEALRKNLVTVTKEQLGLTEGQLMELVKSDDLIAEVSLFHFKKAIEANPKNATYHLYLAQHRWRRGDTDEAWEYFSSAMRCDPRHLPTLRAAGTFLVERCMAAINSHTHQERYDDIQRTAKIADEIFRTALTAEPMDTVCLANYSILLDEVLHKKTEASAIREALKQHSKNLMEARNSNNVDDDDDNQEETSTPAARTPSAETSAAGQKSTPEKEQSSGAVVKPPMETPLGPSNASSTATAAGSSVPPKDNDDEDE